MKTILLPIYNGIRSRDFFRTDLFKVLAADSKVRLVIAAPEYKLDFYKKEFGRENVFFEPLPDIREPFLGRFLNALAFNFLDTGTVRQKQYQMYARAGNFSKFISRRFLTVISGNKKFLRKFIRLLDRALVSPNKEVLNILDKYKPNLVITPDIILPIDRMFLRAAKNIGVRTIGMVRSWDNLTAKGVIQILPDRLIAQTNQMKLEAIKYADMPEEDIAVLGVPQFDHYFKPPKFSREEFFKSLGIPAERRLILCAPFFDIYSNSSGTKIINALARAIDAGRLPRDLHLLVRYRPESMPEDFSEEKLLRNPNITVTVPYSLPFLRKNKRSDYEFSASDVDMLFNSIYFSDVTINTISTLTIDAVALDKPVINIRFDGDPATPPAYQVSLYTGYDHYNFIENAKAVRLAYNMDELISQINQYLKKPQLDKEGRKIVRDAQIEFFDGFSGKRSAEFILKELSV